MADLVAYLDRMRFMLRVEVADVTAAWAVVGEPVGRESAVGEPVAWVDPWPRTGEVSVAYGSTDVEHVGRGWAWREVLVPRGDLAATLAERPRAGTWALEALRVAAGRPRHLRETDHRTIPHELDLLRTAVHLQKGCYRGQETVARVHNLGRPPRRVVLLHLDGSGHLLPAPGTELRLGDKVVGRLTTVARHHELGPVALGVVKRNTPVDAVLDADGVAAAQDVLVTAVSRFLARPATTLITVAPTGAEQRKDDVPQLPTTPEEIAAEAAACEAAGAAMIHVHVRDAAHEPTLDLPRVREVVAAVRDASSLVVQLSTGGSVHDPMPERLRVLDAGPDSCSLTLGTVNFGDDVFMNPWGFVVELFRDSRDRGIVPEFEVFDLGQLSTLRRLLDREGLPAGGKVHVDLVMGVPGGMPGTTDALVACVAAMPEQVTSWSATGIGRTHLPVLGRVAVGRRPPARRHGGHRRVGPRSRRAGAGGLQRRAGGPRGRRRHRAAAPADDRGRRARAARPARTA